MEFSLTLVTFPSPRPRVRIVKRTTVVLHVSLNGRGMRSCAAVPLN